MIKPYDLGRNNVVENCKQIEINSLIKNVNRKLKYSLLQQEMEISGINVSICTSKTRFNGERLWFVCPRCKKRVGILYFQDNLVECRTCLRLYYKNQRYKNMIEEKN